MFIQDNVPLQAYSTMRLGGTAAYLSEVNGHQELPQLVAWARERDLPIIMVGDGSNIIWNDDGFPGLVIVNKLLQFDTYELDENTTYLTIGGGENWDSAVARTVEMGLNGVAELSLIPGSAGATPVQNVGAYGREISDCLATLEAFDLLENKFVTIPALECGFGYRTSRFKTTDRGRFLITSITLMLTRDQPKPPFYDALASYFAEHGFTSPSLKEVREAVIAIRSSKLPDPKFVANNGSFFANPFVESSQFSQLIADNPTMKYWHTDDERTKLSAAWLVEQAGFKDFHDPETGMATWAKQPLVLINEHANSTADLLKFKQKIVDAVQAKFGIILQQEPELI